MPALRSLAAAFSRVPAPARGAVWMVMSGASFAILTALIRHASADLHPFELVFFRSLFGLLFMLPWFLRTGLRGLRTRRPGLHGVRALSGLAAMLCWFSAVALMPVAEVTALSFTTPLFATLGAVLFLGETVRRRRWTATAVGFAGAMIILRPGAEAFGVPALLALSAAAMMAISVLLVKVLSRTETASTVVLYMGLLMTPLALVPALFVWTMPSPQLWVWMVLMGLAGTAGHLTLVRAFAAADASAVLPFDFSRLIFAAFLGYAFFAERPDVWTWVGAAVIFAATLYTAHRETRLGRAVRPASEALRHPAMDGAAAAVDPATGKAGSA